MYKNLDIHSTRILENTMLQVASSFYPHSSIYEQYSLNSSLSFDPTQFDTGGIYVSPPSSVVNVAPSVQMPEIGSEELSNIAFTETITLVYTLLIIGLVLLYSVIHHCKRTFKYIRYLELPKKKLQYPRFRKIIYYRLFGDHSVLELGYFTAFTLLTIGFTALATPSLDFLLKSSGTILAPLILFNVILPLRNGPLLFLTSTSYNRYFTYHRWMGSLIFVYSIIHTIFYITNLTRPAIQNDPFLIQHLFIPFPARTFGTLSLLSLIFVMVSSIYKVRRKHYNFFRFSHYTVYLFVVLTMIHRPYYIPWGIATLLIALTDNVIYILFGCCTSWDARLKVYGDNFLKVKLYRGDRIKHYESGQHVYINVPAVSAHEWHPFTIVSSPLENEIELGIRNLGNHTSKLIDYAKSNPLSTVRLYGPFGRYPFNYKRYSDIVIVCAGIGITPYISLLRDLYSKNSYDSSESIRIKNVSLYWLCKNMDTYNIYSTTLMNALEESKRNWNAPAFKLFIYLKSYEEETDEVRNNPIFQPKPKMLDMFQNICNPYRSSVSEKPLYDIQKAKFDDESATDTVASSDHTLKRTHSQRYSASQFSDIPQSGYEMKFQSVPSDTGIYSQSDVKSMVSQYESEKRRLSNFETIDLNMSSADKPDPNAEIDIELDAEIAQFAIDRVYRIAILSTGSFGLTRDVWDASLQCTDNTFQFDFYQEIFEY